MSSPIDSSGAAPDSSVVAAPDEPVVVTPDEPVVVTPDEPVVVTPDEPVAVVEETDEPVAAVEEDAVEAVEDDIDVDFDVHEARPPFRSRRAALILAGGLVSAILVAWFVHWILGLDRTSEPAAVSTLEVMTPAPATPTAVNSRPAARPLLVIVSEPPSLGARLPSSEDKPPPRAYMTKIEGATVVSGAYGEFASRNFVTMSAAVSAHLLYPDQEIDALVGDLQLEDPNFRELDPVFAGPLGGLARCGASKFAELPMAICVWAADQSIGVIVWIDQPLDQAKAEFEALRGQIERLAF